MSKSTHPGVAVRGRVREQHFADVLGSVRGRGEPANLLRAGDTGERELQRLCALVDAGELKLPLQALCAHADELAPELARPQAELASEAFFWQLWSDMWAISRRITRSPCNRVERLLDHYVRASPAAHLPDNHKTGVAISAFRYFGAVPHLLAAGARRRMLEEAMVVLTLRTTLHKLLIVEPAGSTRYSLTPNDEFEAWAAVMAEWTLAASPKVVLVHTLGAEGAAELFEYLEGLGIQGWSAERWLTSRYLPFTNWQFFYSDCLLHTSLTPPRFRGGVGCWGPRARQQLQEGLLTMPDCIYG